MRVLVTGASGGIGSAACRELHAAGHEVIATDRADRGNIPVKLHAADLLDRNAVSALCVRLDAVLHLGNHTGYKLADPQIVFGENMVMNINVLAAAQAAGAKKMVFASSIQVTSSQPRLPNGEIEPLPYLPLDGEIPEFSTNPYALSKACGETMLRFYTRVYGTQTVAIRFPSTADPESHAPEAAKFPEVAPRAKTLGFSCMTYTDAGRLCAATIAADLPGYRCYLPSSAHNLLRQPAAMLVREFYEGVPLRKPIGEGTATLVDLSGITADTGWRPLE